MKSEYEKHMFWDDNNICSNIYHEIYHIRNDVNSETDWDSKLQNLNSIRYFDTPPDNLMNYLRALHIENTTPHTLVERVWMNILNIQNLWLLLLCLRSII